MVEMQRAIAARESVVMDGRDIGTHVMPFADCKFYLTASVEERARRRFRELVAGGAAVNYDDLRREIAQRDQQDMNREYAPLRQAPDAVLIDTTRMSENAVIEKVIEFIRERMDGENE
jgi:cytidylate kinase